MLGSRGMDRLAFFIILDGDAGSGRRSLPVDLQPALCFELSLCPWIWFFCDVWVSINGQLHGARPLVEVLHLLLDIP